ncbi:catalase [Candidatus Binatia bacterium]|nr:catalase [Candidatus Binatia bacterium]
MIDKKKRTLRKTGTATPSPGFGKQGDGGETHQTAAKGAAVLTTTLGTPIADDQSSLRLGARGPTLLEDFVMRDKITHFDHERIPERVVHARGSGAHGYFEPYRSHAKLTRAAFLSDPKVRTPVFVRFSTVAGSEGSLDTARDVRGFAVKFYTSEGNFDLVGNNIPVFFIQDGIKFPDLVHSVKPEPDRGFPQAQSAHDTFWDFVSLTPESTHMLLWVMSDRAIPRSFRMMEGFGVHTFRLINARGESTFVKWHWRPKLGSFSLIWDEAVKLGGADPDFHRRDLWESIANGDFPEFELSVQAFDQKTADSFDFDVLDPTKIIPEEIVPLTPLGRMVLDRNPDNFFAETEQVAFCASHVVPGIDFTNDPLLQVRLFSYQDTQLSRLGSPNFNEIPINRPKCPMHALARDGHMRQEVDRGRVSYEPNSLDPSGPREEPARGFASFAEPDDGVKLRARPESFADHYTQARLFWLSMTKPEQDHIVNGFAFELAKVETVAIRRRMLGQLENVHRGLAGQVAEALGMEGQAERIAPAVPATEDVQPSPALSLIAKAPKSIAGRKIGVLVTDGADDRLLDALRKRVTAEGARVVVVAPKVGGVTSAAKKALPADMSLSGAPSAIFDAVVVAAAEPGIAALLHEAAATDWVRDAFGHLKIVGFTAAAEPLLAKAGVATDADEGVVRVDGRSLDALIAAAGQHRIWDREPTLRTPG